MAMGIWIVSLLQRVATAARIRVVIHHLFAALSWQLLRPGTRVPLLASAHAATAAIATDRLFERWAIVGWRPGRVMGVAVEPFPQLNKLSGKGGE
jgi:hypothetical protein